MQWIVFNVDTGWVWQPLNVRSFTRNGILSVMHLLSSVGNMARCSVNVDNSMPSICKITVSHYTLQLQHWQIKYSLPCFRNFLSWMKTSLVDMPIYTVAWCPAWQNIAAIAVQCIYRVPSCRMHGFIWLLSLMIHFLVKFMILPSLCRLHTKH